MSKQLNFEVLGTKCASCEILIERELKKMQGVRNATVSHANRSISIFADDNADITQGNLDTVLRPHGYRVKEATNTSAPLELDLKRFGGMLVVILALYLLLKKTGFLNFSPSVEGPTSYMAILGIGLVAAFSSCTAVVGGLIAAIASTKAKAQEHLCWTAKLMPHVLFNVGRLAGFVVLGAAIGWIGQSLALSSTANGIFVLVIAFLMVIMGINLVGIFNRPVFMIKPPRFLAHRVHDLTHSSNPLIPLVAGAATFFLPCGFTQSMQLYALSLGDPKAAALTMGLFALGTMPALIGIGAITSLAKGQWLQRITKAAGALVIVLGISNMQNGAALLDLRLIPSTSGASKQAPITLENGEQVITMRVTSAGVYQPAKLTVTEGIPVRWDILGDSYMGCASTLVMRAFNVKASLKPGTNTVRFTPTKSGEFGFSCAMGMVRGTMTVRPNNT